MPIQRVRNAEDHFILLVINDRGYELKERAIVSLSFFTVGILLISYEMEAVGADYKSNPAWRFVHAFREVVYFLLTAVVIVFLILFLISFTNQILTAYFEAQRAEKRRLVEEQFQEAQLEQNRKYLAYEEKKRAAQELEEQKKLEIKKEIARFEREKRNARSAQEVAKDALDDFI